MRIKEDCHERLIATRLRATLHSSGNWLCRARLDGERGDCQVSVLLLKSGGDRMQGALSLTLSTKHAGTADLRRPANAQRTSQRDEDYLSFL
jgi:hypothetical protein